MDPRAKNAAGSSTPTKNPQTNRSKTTEISRVCENSNPNLASPGLKPSKSPAVKSATKTQKSPSRNLAKPRERKFVVAKRSSKREETDSAVVTSQKCLDSAYESLRASQEDFFKNRDNIGRVEEEEGEKKNPLVETLEVEGFALNRLNGSNPDGIEHLVEMGSSQIKERRGKVMNLVKAFERLLTTSSSSKELDQENEEKAEDDEKEMESKEPETQISSASSCPSPFFFTSQSLGLDSGVDNSHGSVTTSTRTSGGGRRSRRTSCESSGTFCGSHRKRRQLKATSQKPFELLTEQRGRNKEEEFSKKVQQMMIEEEKQRIPIAQGLPWTTDEPQYLVKPPVKESTMPVDLMLHSDLRAMERTEFDQQVAGKMSIIEQYKMEKERQQKLAEEEEIRRLRKELVPRAQPMPYFDRPFVPRRSVKHPTLPREPKFHLPEQKKIKCVISC
ncbi:microtubule-destabilizing protein 60-like [Rhododendron vialii]|uniref:microtubule-destabilizing protein 60-like n=1 Tax=Rhododendron vialii TaxID=182163 RepID=UPI00265EB8CB|nr:microtubule-destabilizing protein 60-like [Rhododendron vialii]